MNKDGIGFTGFSVSPRRFRDSLSPLRGLLLISFAKKNKEKPLGPGYLCPCDIAVRIREIPARPWVGVPVSSLALKFVLKDKELERLI